MTTSDTLVVACYEQFRPAADVLYMGERPTPVAGSSVTMLDEGCVILGIPA